MPWGVSEGGVPQPYRMAIESAHWEKARDRDGKLVTNRQGENLMNLVFEGAAHRLVEDEDGSFTVGEAIEPVDGKTNRRSFLIGNTSQWVDPREDGKRIEAVRGPDEMPWAKCEVGRLINSLVETVGGDELEKWGKWEEAATWQGRTFDLVPQHDVNKDGEPVTYTDKNGTERIDWYFVAAGVSGSEAKATAPKGRSRSRKADSNGETDLKALLAKAYKGFDGNEDEFVDFIQTDEFEGKDAVALLSDDEFDAIVSETVA